MVRINASKKKKSLKQKLDELVIEMINGQIRYLDAKQEFEKCFLSHIIERENGNLSRAAQTLNIHRNTLRKKMRT